MARLDRNGRDVSHEYRVRCLESWHQSGFSVLSINSAREQIEGNGFQIARTGKDASQMIGRPHVFISDVLAIASQEAAGEPFAIVNADVVLTCHLADQVRSIAAGEFLFSRRIDIDDPSHEYGEPYHGGFDFFGCHPSDVADIKTGLIFGAPWWDQYLPLALYRKQCRIQQIEPSILHLKHDERWKNGDVWRSLGKLFVSENRNRYRDEYDTKLNRAIKRHTGRMLSDLKYSIWKRLPTNAKDEPTRMLNRVSQANISFLDSVSGYR